MTSPILAYVIITSLVLVHTNDAQSGPIRDTMNGKVMGITESTFSKDDVDFFYGIPYAQPPVGPLRFEDPRAPLNWTDTFSATDLPTSCPQINDDRKYVDMHRMGIHKYGEDCLYLNVFQPRSKSIMLAVLVFIHGGSNMVGSGVMFDGGYLAVYGEIIVVTVNYRLAALGDGASWGMLPYVYYSVLGPRSGVSHAQTYDLTKKTYLHFHADNEQPEVSLRQNLAPRAENFWLTYLPPLIKRLRKDKSVARMNTSVPCTRISVPCTPTNVTSTPTPGGSGLIRHNPCMVLLVILVSVYGQSVADSN